MNNLIKAIAAIDYEELAENTDTLFKLVTKLRGDAEQLSELNLDGLFTEELTELNSTIDSLVQVLETNDSLLMAADEDQLWVDHSILQDKFN